VKKTIAILIGIALNKFITFFDMVIFTILILLVHEHGSSTVFYDLFLQCFIVVIVEILNFFENSCA
jgi:hypothetical protein